MRGWSRAEIISRETGAEDLKIISTPAAKETGRETEEEKRHYLNDRRLSGKVGCKLDDDDGDTLSSDEVTRYSRIAARANFLAQDRTDIAFIGVSDKVSSQPDEFVPVVFGGRRHSHRRSLPSVVNRYNDQNESDQVVPGGCFHRGAAHA